MHYHRNAKTDLNGLLRKIAWNRPESWLRSMKCLMQAATNGRKPNLRKIRNQSPLHHSLYRSQEIKESNMFIFNPNEMLTRL